MTHFRTFAVATATLLSTSAAIAQGQTAPAVPAAPAPLPASAPAVVLNLPPITDGAQSATEQAAFDTRPPAPLIVIPDMPPPGLPQATRAMLEAAAATRDNTAVDTMARFARQTQPDHVAEIDAFVAEYRDGARRRLAEAAAARRIAIAERGVLDGWTGQVQAGASRATGNTSNSAVTGALALNRTGNVVDYKFRARADYQRTRGVTTQERYLAELSPQYRFDERLFAFGLGRWERDRFQGFSNRWTASGGVGYRPVDAHGQRLDVRSGPAWRKSDLILGHTEGSVGWLTEGDFRWQVTPTLKLGQTGSALFDTRNNSFIATTSVDARLIGPLSARFAYSVEHNSDPPLATLRTDTLSRFTLVYDF